MIRIILLLALAYPIFQLYALRRWKHGWRKAAIVPLGIMIGALLISLVGLFLRLNLLPLTLLYGAPSATLYLSVVGILKLVYNKKDESAIDKDDDSIIDV